MEESANLNYTYQLHQNMIRNNLNYVYRGGFTSHITDRLLSLAEQNLDQIGEASKVKKKVYFIMVECLQNITRHQAEEHIEDDATAGIFMIKKVNDDYYITSGNPIKKENINGLKSRLEEINNLSNDELKALRHQILESGIFSDKGGAGLGLIEIARKSGQKLQYDFQPLNDDYSFFYLQTKIPTLNQEEVAIKEDGLKDSIVSVRMFHETMIAKSLILIYEGEFNQDIVTNVLSMTESNLTAGQEKISTKKKVYSVMVELLQNISKHASRFSDNEHNSGIFLVGKKGNEYIITGGNAILNDEVPKLKEKIEHINSLNRDELEKLFDKQLWQDQKDSKGGAGLGLIDLAWKSRKKLIYNFEPIDDNFSFFSIQIRVESEL